MAYLDSGTEKTARTALQRAMGYLGSDSSGPMTPPSGWADDQGVAAFAGQAADAVKTGYDVASAGLSAQIARQQNNRYAQYAETIARTRHDQQKRQAARSNRGGLFGTALSLGGTLLGGAIGGPAGAAIGGKLGGSLGGMIA